jgi:hypothetical protein
VIVNGSAKDPTARISGYNAVFALTAPATVRNFGAIASTWFGVELAAGGSLTNGSSTVTAALVEGKFGIGLQGGASTTNFGTILGQGVAYGYGADLKFDASLTNGSTKDATALLEGAGGVSVYGASTVTNFGTIQGTDNVVVRFTSPDDKLVAEAGSKFVGEVYGGGGALELASGIGKLAGLFTNASVSVYGSMPMTTFTDFYSLTIGQGASFSEKSGVSIADFESVDDAGTLTLGAAGSKGGVVNGGLIETTGTGTLTIAGAVLSSGTLEVKGGEMIVDGPVTADGIAMISGGTLDLTAAFAQNVTFSSGGGVLELGLSQGFEGVVTGFSKTGASSLDLLDVGFVSAWDATYSGTKTEGVLTVTDGTHTAHFVLDGNYLASTFTCASDGHGGTTVIDPTGPAPVAPVATAGTHRLVARWRPWGRRRNWRRGRTTGPRRDCRSWRCPTSRQSDAQRRHQRRTGLTNRN